MQRLDAERVLAGGERALVTVSRSRSRAIVASLTACTQVPGYDGGTGSDYAIPSCSTLQAAVANYARSGTGDIDSALQALADNCSDEYEIAVDYVSHARDSEFRIESCDEMLDYGVRSESVALLEEDGWCTYGAVNSPQPPRSGPKVGSDGTAQRRTQGR